MAANWGSFQSAIQLATGTNIALFALPRLAEPVIHIESQRWEALSLSARSILNNNLRQQVERERLQFRIAIRELEISSAKVRRFALWVAALATIALLRASCYPDAAPDVYLWMVLAVGSVPSIILAGMNLRASRKISARANVRRILAAQCEAEV